jgi:hypothetical protein
VIAENRESQIMGEREEIDRLYESLFLQPKHTFPEPGKSFEAPVKHGVYVIYEAEDVLHVGRTIRGEQGLRQRLGNHLRGKSSFARAYLQKRKINLRDKSFLFQFLEEPDPRKRALLEALAIGKLCPLHIGVGVVE